MNTLAKNYGNGRALFSGFPALFDDFFTRDLEFFNGRLSNSMPAVNIKENKDHFAIELAVPGMEKGDFNIEVKNQVLTISAKKESNTEQKDESGKFICKQFGYQNFSRSFTLPAETTDAENIQASYNNGILNVNIPKKEKANPSKQIQIS